MKEVIGDLWLYHEQGHTVAITTNGVVKANGENVMGAGVAKHAKILFPELPLHIGQHIQMFGNIPFIDVINHIVTFPVKWHWKNPADLSLIKTSAKILDGMILTELYLPRPGCGNGQLDWKDVKPVLEELLDDRFIVVSLPGEVE